MTGSADQASSNRSGGGVPAKDTPAQMGFQVVRGFAMGAADVVPGVSGGTIALLFGIYDRLIMNVRQGARALGRLVKADVKGFFAQLKLVEWTFLIPLVVGVLVALGGLSTLIDNLLHDYPEEMAGLFFGLVVASIVVARREVTNWDGQRLGLAAVVGVAAFFLLGFSAGFVTDPAPWAYVGAGAIAICAMILPGISGSFLLLMMGMYGAVLGAVSDRDIGTVLLVGIGATIGLALFSSALSWLLETHRNTLVAALIGLMAGSLRVLWPWPNGVGVSSEDEDEVISGTGLEWPASDEIFGPVILALLAFALVYGLSTIAEKQTETSATS